MKKFLILSFLISLLSSSPLMARTYSVVTFNSEEGIIFIDGQAKEGAYDIFEALAVDVTIRGGAIKKLYTSKDKKLKISCDGPLMCAIIVYPSNNAVLDFDTNAVHLVVNASDIENYSDLFRGDFSYNHEGLIIEKNAKNLTISFEGQILNGGASL